MLSTEKTKNTSSNFTSNLDSSSQQNNPQNNPSEDIQTVDIQTAKQWFNQFVKQYGNWIQKQARLISWIKNNDDVEDIYQELLVVTWNACLHPDYNATKGKSPNSWIHQRLTWDILTMLSAQANPTSAVEDFAPLFASIGPGSSSGEPYALLSGSVSLANMHKRVEEQDLIDKILKVCEQLPERNKIPLKELLKPSPAFDNYLQNKKRPTTSDEQKEYNNTCKFEVCSVADITRFTGISLFHLQVAIRYIQNKFPELKKYMNTPPKTTTSQNDSPT